MTPRGDLPVIMQRALKLATPSLRQLAEETGITYASLKAWSAGHRTPNAENANIVADALKARAAALAELAERLRRAAE
jgi:transcriptional regulator with XRE-family HTH domain